tara:strand:- start:7505 stop:8680 length:1176 start_codon:yes stop_codon:yes gene_type:complete
MIYLEYTDPTKGELVYISTEDNRIDTSVPKNNGQLAFLFKITNDMGKTYSQTLNGVTSQVVAQYAYGQSPYVFDRYTRCTLRAEATTGATSVSDGKILGLPVGYYKYEVYEASAPFTIASYSCRTVPQTEDGQMGTLKVRKDNFSTGQVMSTTNLIGNTYYKDQQATGLNGGGNYYFNLQTSCGTSITSAAYIVAITSVEAQADGSRWLEVTGVTTTATGVEYTIKSNAPVGHSYDWKNNTTGSYGSVTEITSQPQTNTITFAYNASNSSYQLNLYNSDGGNAGGGSKVWGVSGGRNFSVPNPSFNYGHAQLTAWNPESVDSGGTTLSTGNLWYNVRYGANANVAEQDFFTIQGKVEEGKLYIKQGDENIKEVKYTEHESPVTSDYIYYGQ